jgi:hypothetical protein
MHDAGAACVYVETARRPPHTVRVSAEHDAEYQDNGVSSWTLLSAAPTPFRHAALRRIRRSLTVQVLFTMPAAPVTGSHIQMM